MQLGAVEFSSAGSWRFPWVWVQSPVRPLAECLAQRRPSREPQHLRSWAANSPLGSVVRCNRLVTQPRELVVPGEGELAGARLDLLIVPHASCLRRPLHRPARVAAGGQPATRAATPARSWFRVSTERPSLTATSASVQPTGRSRMHGTCDAEAPPTCKPRQLQNDCRPGCRCPAASLGPWRCHRCWRGTRRRTPPTALPRLGRPGGRSSAADGNRLGRGRRQADELPACGSRPWARSIQRSCDGRASPRAAAKPSVISSTENWRRARS